MCQGFSINTKGIQDSKCIYSFEKANPHGSWLGRGFVRCGACYQRLKRIVFIRNFSIQKRRVGGTARFFIDGSPKLATGRGEILEEITLDLKGKHLLLIYPDIHVGTAEAYAGVDFYKDSKSVKEILSLPSTEWQGQLENSFEKSIFAKHSVMLEIKKNLIENGAQFAAMSGSGSTLFGIFETEQEKLKLAIPNQQFCLEL
jgi:4-diphosphocytidyl-2C-methyl-D-erythritol kinase